MASPTNNTNSTWGSALRQQTVRVVLVVSLVFAILVAVRYYGVNKLDREIRDRFEQRLRDHYSGLQVNVRSARRLESRRHRDSRHYDSRSRWQHSAGHCPDRRSDHSLRYQLAGTADEDSSHQPDRCSPREAPSRAKTERRVERQPFAAAAIRGWSSSACDDCRRYGGSNRSFARKHQSPHPAKYRTDDRLGGDGYYFGSACSGSARRFQRTGNSSA